MAIVCMFVAKKKKVWSLEFSVLFYHNEDCLRLVYVVTYWSSGCRCTVGRPLARPPRPPQGRPPRRHHHPTPSHHPRQTHPHHRHHPTHPRRHHRLRQRPHPIPSLSRLEPPLLHLAVRPPPTGRRQRQRQQPQPHQEALAPNRQKSQSIETQSHQKHLLV